MAQLARFHGCCPVCGKYMAVSRSWVTALLDELPHDPRWTEYHRGGWLVQHGRVRDALRGAKWIHAKCEAPLRKRSPDLPAEVARRRAALLEIQANEQRNGG